MVEDIIRTINRELVDLFKSYPGVKVYGMSQTMTRKAKKGKDVTIPAVVDKDGEGKWVGVDDTAPMIIYHKTLSPMTSRAVEGYGDLQDITNTYNNGIIVSFDRSKICLTADEVQTHIQARMPGLHMREGFKSIKINVLSVILNSQQVYDTEYKNGEGIDPKYSMLQISYQIESRFSKACFAKCL